MKLGDVIKQTFGHLPLAGEATMATAPVACAICNDTGVVSPDVPVGHPKFGMAMGCPARCQAYQERQQRIAAAIMRRANIQIGHEYSFDSFWALGDEAIAGKLHACGATMLWAERGQFTLTDAARRVGNVSWSTAHDKCVGGLVLWGQPGRGKTGLASAAVNWLIAAGKACYFTRMDDYFLSQADRYSGEEGDRGAADRVRCLAETVSYLVLDEVSQESPSIAKRDALDRLLRIRDNQQLPTLLTTNYNKEQFASVWGMRAGSIAAKCHWVLVGGIELRETWGDQGEVF